MEKGGKIPKANLLKHTLKNDYDNSIFFVMNSTYVILTRKIKYIIYILLL